jgi:hypothetical protein
LDPGEPEFVAQKFSELFERHADLERVFCRFIAAF